MDPDVKNTMEDVARGEVLLYLTKVYPDGATPTMLRHYLDAERSIRLTEEKFAFHIRYLAESGFVTCDLHSRGLGEPERIRLVKITKAGIDRVEGRPKDASGVML